MYKFIYQILKSKYTWLLIGFLIITIPYSANCQELLIKSKDGSDKSFDLMSIQKVTFSDNSLIINYTSGNSESNELSNIRKVYFNNVPVDVKDEDLKEINESVIVYPNPVNDFLYIKNLNEEASNAEIFGMDGTLILSYQLQSTNRINVSNLASGSYLIKINDHIIKFVKL